MNESEPLRWCNACQTQHPLSAFPLKRRSRDGWETNCRDHINRLRKLRRGRIGYTDAALAAGARARRRMDARERAEEAQRKAERRELFDLFVGRLRASGMSRTKIARLAGLNQSTVRKHTYRPSSAPCQETVERIAALAIRHCPTRRERA